MLNSECPQFIVSLVRNRIQQWADNKNKRQGISGIWHFVLQTPHIPIPDAIVTQYSHCDFVQVACNGEMIGRWFVTDSKVVPIDTNAGPPPDGVFTQIMKVMLFDFSISQERSRFILVESDMDDRVTHGVHDLT